MSRAGQEEIEREKDEQRVDRCSLFRGGGVVRQGVRKDGAGERDRIGVVEEGRRSKVERQGGGQGDWGKDRREDTRVRECEWK